MTLQRHGTQRPLDELLLAADRIGARACWRGCATLRLRPRCPRRPGPFVELVFVHIEELSGASVAGHGGELATTGRAREP